MEIKNFNKIEGERLEIRGAELYITEVAHLQRLQSYIFSLKDYHSHETLFIIELTEKNGYLDMRCELQKDTGVGKNYQTKAVLIKKDADTINSFKLSIAERIAKNRIMETFCYLIAETQNFTKNKNKLKLNSPGGLYNTPRII